MPESRHPTPDLCERCMARFLDHVHCGHPQCTFKITVCVACDQASAVSVFMTDHMSDCEHGPASLPAEHPVWAGLRLRSSELTP